MRFDTEWSLVRVQAVCTIHRYQVHCASSLKCSSRDRIMAIIVTKWSVIVGKKGTVTIEDGAASKWQMHSFRLTASPISFLAYRVELLSSTVLVPQTATSPSYRDSKQLKSYQFPTCE